MKEIPDRYKDGIDAAIRQASKEDIGAGDVTGDAIIPEESNCSGSIVAKESGIVAGIAVAEQTFLRLDERIRFSAETEDGASVETGEAIAHIEGPTRAILMGERTALNFLQRMSGIATLTRKFVDAVPEDSPSVILDTRKTAPGLRAIDKWAVALGGGVNHRFGLDDAVLIKENHIKIAGGIEAAMELVQSSNGWMGFVEVEVRNLDELKEALYQKVDRIMLDNMELDDIKRAVQITNGQVPLEVSGNVRLEIVGDIAETGIDYISVGQLTHSPPVLDVTFLIDEVPANAS
ncbi:MAG: nicotinate-nucleotide diphosphorylase (carboxylating) [Dehalococcoidales bacterium]|jgi:nicotinate-nucleotide pyrophosphorylase (carboxylating)|nr:nicotinate-nucleotide diphosphorylase (carboxylating) [Dehalococcoidales bacterium]|tara:strand:- start:6410 stop:7282 length:873 start_codon:yes stop_codon:yes gene_type:complete